MRKMCKIHLTVKLLWQVMALLLGKHRQTRYGRSMQKLSPLIAPYLHRLSTTAARLYRKMPRLNKKEFFKKHGRKAFWLWITYQAVKGTTTTSLIWIPLILHTCSHK